MSRHLERVRELPCCICEAEGKIQTNPTTAHHCIHGRYGTKKVPDRMAIPLCDCHHQALWGGSAGKLAIHKGKESWAAAYGQDVDYIPQTLDKIEKFRE